MLVARPLVQVPNLRAVLLVPCLVAQPLILLLVLATLFVPAILVLVPNLVGLEQDALVDLNLDHLHHLTLVPDLVVAVQEGEIMPLHGRSFYPACYL